MKTTVIGLTGLAGSGKDTAAEIMAECGGFSRLGFADALYGEVCEAFNVERWQLARRDLKEVPTKILALRHCRSFGFLGAAVLALQENSADSLQELLDAPRSPRQVLQLWGTEYRRRQNPAYWTRIVVDKVATLRKAGVCNFVISDVRYANEAATVKLMGGHIWRIDRPGLQAVSDHSSEVDGSQFEPSRVLKNTGDMKHLRSEVLAAHWEHTTGLPISELNQAQP